MCSKEGCLCSNKADKTSWSTISAEDLKNKYDSGRDFTSNPFEMATADEEGFTDYLNCIKNVKDDATTTSDFYNFAKAFRESEDYDDIVEYLEFFESEYSCAGICSPALFYFSVSVD